MTIYHLDGNNLIINLDHIVTIRKTAHDLYTITMVNNHQFTINKDALIDILTKILVG